MEYPVCHSEQFPIVVQNVFSTAVSSADVIMVGMIGQDSLSAVSLAGQVTFVLNLILLGLTIGTSLIVAQYLGKGDILMIERIQGYSIRIAFILPGITIGEYAVIGAGSVVTKDIPAYTIAAGNPCRVIRKITEADRNKHFAGREIDEEAWLDILRIEREENDNEKYPVAEE